MDRAQERQYSEQEKPGSKKMRMALESDQEKLESEQE